MDVERFKSVKSVWKGIGIKYREMLWKTEGRACLSMKSNVRM